MGEIKKAEKIQNMYKYKADKILLNRFLGIPIFFLLIWLMFQTVFAVGQVPMDMIDYGVSMLQNWLTTTLSESLWSSLLIDGVIGGVGAMIIFLPLIIILFFFISVFQQSGYLSRVSFLFEKFFRKIGLDGKSIVSLTMGFGCNVPAIMSLRELGDKRQKIITTMMIPFLSCSATLPIYTIFIAAFFEEQWRGTILFGLYAMGILISVLTGLIFNKFLKKEKLVRSLMLPAYKMPKIKNVFVSIWKTTKTFLTKAGKIILPFSIVMWILFTFPQVDGAPALIEESYAGKISMAIEPIFRPIGFDWRITAALFGALGAKEIFISTFGIFYSLEASSADGLIQALQNDPNVTTLTAVLILLFVLIYSPCIPVIATVKQEFGTKWAVISFLYPSILAWMTCFIVYQIAVYF